MPITPIDPPITTKNLTYHRQVITSTGTFAYTPGLAAAGGVVTIEKLVAGGGASGGIDATNNCSSGGGAGGQVLENITVTISADVTVTIGDGGIAGTSGGGAGGVGGDSSFGSYLTAYGGGGGGGYNAGLGGVVPPTFRYGGGGIASSSWTAGAGAGAGGLPYPQGVPGGTYNIAGNTDYANSIPWTTYYGGYYGGRNVSGQLPGQDKNGYGRGGFGADNNKLRTAVTPPANTGQGGDSVGGSGAVARSGSPGSKGICIVSWWELT